MIIETALFGRVFYCEVRQRRQLSQSHILSVKGKTERTYLEYKLLHLPFSDAMNKKN